MGIFSSIQAALSNPDVQDRLAAIGASLQGDPNAYANYRAETAARQAGEAANQAGVGPVASAPDIPAPAQAPAAPMQDASAPPAAPVAQDQPQSDLNVIRMPFGAPNLPMRPAPDSTPAPAPVQAPPQAMAPAPAPAPRQPMAIPGNQYLQAAMPELLKGAAYSSDPMGTVTKLLQMRDQLARQQAFQAAYAARQGGGGKAPAARGGNPAMQDYEGITGANDANQLFDMAAATYGPEVANSMRENWKAAQPTYTTINGRQQVNSGLHAMDQMSAPEDKDGFTYVRDPNAPGGYRAVATAGWQAVNNSKTGGASLASGIKPPVDGATPVVSGYDPVTGIPNVTAWRLPNGTVQAAGSMAAAKAAGEGSATPYEYDNGDGRKTLTNRTDAARGGAGGRVVGAQYGTEDTYKGAVKDYKDVQDASEHAQSALTNISQLTSLLGQMQTGKLSPLGNDIAATAQSLGLPGDYKNLSNAQAVTTINKAIVAQLKEQMQMPRMTDADLKFLNNGLPGLGNTPQGNAQALAYMRGIAERGVVKAQAADNWVKTYGSLAAPGKAGPNFKAAWSVWQANNPVFAPRPGGAR